MTLCKWCGQESQSNEVCDWCKRPLLFAGAATQAPAAVKSELDLLGNEETVERVSPIKLALVAVAVCIAFGIFIFALKVPLGDKPTVASSSAKSSDLNPPKFDAFDKRPVGGQVPISRGGQNQPGKPRLNKGHNDAASSSKRSRQGTTLAGAPVDQDPPVTIKDVTLAVVPGKSGTKQVMGFGVIHNGSDKSVVDLRAEVVWGSQSYSLTLMRGKPGKYKQIEAKNLAPGEDLRCGLVSQDITKGRSGKPDLVRVQAWLDGIPGSSVCDFRID